MEREGVFLACPLYDGRLDAGAARSLFSTASQQRLHVIPAPQTASLLSANCNSLWCAALNAREESNVKWFAMLHADIEPDWWWLDTLFAEAERHGADLLAAVVPLKDGTGLTSTAIARPGSRYLPFCRLTMRQVRHELFPETFGIVEAADALERLPGELRVAGVPREALLVNTGCFVCRLDRPWCERVWFTINDAIEQVNGKWAVKTQSEDWTFSRMAAEQGAKVMATRILPLAHKGSGQFHSTLAWGYPSDPGCRL